MRNYERNSSLDSDSDMSSDECNYTFQNSVNLAEREDRFIKGLVESANVLEICPEMVDKCILPRGRSLNISTLIQHKLIEAYCWENDIEIVTVDFDEFNQTIEVQHTKSMDLLSIECALITTKPVKEELDIDGRREEGENFC